MDWSKGYSATYYLAQVDPVTWRDIARIEITGGSINREKTGLIESADIDCTGYDDGERWIRVYLDARQNGAAEHVPLFTGLATSPEDEIDGTRVENALQCYSVLKPVDDVLLLRGWYAPRKSKGTDVIRKLLVPTPAPVVWEEGSPLLPHAVQTSTSKQANMASISFLLLITLSSFSVVQKDALDCYVCPLL